MATITNPPNLASTLIDQQTAAVDNVLADAVGYLETLKSVVDIQFGNGFNIDNILPDSYNYASVPDVNFPVFSGGLRPNVTDTGLAGPPEAPSIALASPVDIIMPDVDLITPTNDFAYFEAAYTSALLDPLKAKLLSDLVNGGYGIDSNDEAALYQRARDREVETAMTRIADAGRAMAARGFPLPPGELNISIDRAYQELQDRTSTISRDIFTNAATRFVENRRFTIEQVKDLERLLIGFHNSVQERALNAARAAAELSITVYNALVLRYRARLEAAKTAAEVQRDKIQIEVARAEAQIRLFQGQISAYEARIRQQLEPLRLQVELYRADIDANRALTDGIISRATLQQKVIEATVQQNIQISNLAIENAKAKLTAAVEELRFKTAAAQYGSEKFFSLLAAMVGTINTLAVNQISGDAPTS